MKFRARHYLARTRSHASQIVRARANRAAVRDGNYRNVLWIIGDGRSGTTWLQEMIAARYRFRMMYEPFHPDSGRPFRHFVPNTYIRPDNHPHPMHGAADQVFRGRYCTEFTDRENDAGVYDGLVIKDVFANLLAGWASARFPHMKMVLLIRNPFSVAISKSKTKHWDWPDDPATFLDQAQLVDDYPGYFRDLQHIADADFIGRQVFFWSLQNAVPISQAGSGSLYVLFYEDLLARPNAEVAKMMSQLFGNEVDERPALDESLLARPSRGSDSGLKGANEEALVRWIKSNPSSYGHGRQVIEQFGLEFLYGDSVQPLRRSGPLPWREATDGP